MTVSDDTLSTKRCPLTVDWIRGRADIEVKQLVLLEVPTRLAPPEVVVRAPSSALEKKDQATSLPLAESETE